MTTPPLPPLTLAAGLALIRNTPLTSPFEADEQFGSLLDRLLGEPIDPSSLLTILEELRTPLNRVLDSLADEYRSRLLPLEVDHRATFLQVIYRWQQMAQAYATAAGQLRPEATDLQAGKLQATLQQRALHYIGRELFEYYLARQEIPTGLWQRLHTLYLQAEQRGHDHTPVDDSNETTQHQTHCAATYVASLLIEMVSPYGHTLRNLELIRRWAMNWSALVGVIRLDDDLEVPPYLVRLDQDKPLHLFDRHDTPDANTRYLDCTRLGLQINHLLSQMQTHITPAQLGLGDEPAYVIRPLLVRLLRPWTQAASPRKFRRFASTGSARVTSGFYAMHYAVLGKPFIQPDPSIGYSRAAANGLYTFGEQIRAMPESGHYGHPDVKFEEWQVLNHSANGFRLSRPPEGTRLALGQSIAVCPHDGEHFLLCRINWIMEEVDGNLDIGLSVLGGLPLAVGVRTAKTHDQYQLAFLLPASPVTDEGNSLMLPIGTYIPKGELEVLQDETRSTLRLLHVIERGIDFDRVTYETV